MATPHLLVLGAGSVGKRHLRNLAALGASVSAMDPREDRLREAASEGALRRTFTSLDEAADGLDGVDGLVVCSPPTHHVDQCLWGLDAGLPILLEKPLAPTLADASRLAARQDPFGPSILLGYTYRWWPPLEAFRDRIAALDRPPRYARFDMSAHLADWHPWERYQDFFMASQDLGGGALLDESHFIDLMLWFFGMPARVMAQVDTVSGLEIDTDDHVDVIAAWDDGLRVNLHLDLYGRPHRKDILVSCEGETLRWSFEPNRVASSSEASGGWDEARFENERNDMFVAVAREFLGLLEGSAEPRCTVSDGMDVLRVVEACRTSSREGRAVEPGEVTV